MSAEWVMAVCAVVTLVIYFSALVIGGFVSIFRKIDITKIEIMTDVNKKHHQNDLRYTALNALVIRHSVLLDPELSGDFSRGHDDH